MTVCCFVHLDVLGIQVVGSAEKDFEIPLSRLDHGQGSALVADDLGVEVGDVVPALKR